MINSDTRHAPRQVAAVENKVEFEVAGDPEDVKAGGIMVKMGFGRIVASETEAPNMLANPV